VKKSLTLICSLTVTSAHRLECHPPLLFLGILGHIPGGEQCGPRTPDFRDEGCRAPQIEQQLGILEDLVSPLQSISLIFIFLRGVLPNLRRQWLVNKQPLIERLSNQILDLKLKQTSLVFAFLVIERGMRRLMQTLQPRAQERVARTNVMGKKPKWPVPSQRFDPERDLRELNGGRVQVNSKQAFLDDPAFAPSFPLVQPAIPNLLAQRTVGIEIRRRVVLELTVVGVEELLTQIASSTHQEMRRATRKINDPQRLDFRRRLVLNRSFQGLAHEVLHNLLPGVKRAAGFTG
jgi:hypothetical protein